jgi:hypothetical protein
MIASGLVTVNLRAFSAPLPKHLVLNLNAVATRDSEENAVVRFISRARIPRRATTDRSMLYNLLLSLATCMRLYSSIPRDYHGECDFSNPARGPTDLRGVAAHSPLVEKGPQ